MRAAEAEAETAALGGEGTATIMFTDVANPTSLAAYAGDRRWSDAIGRRPGMVARIVTGHEGALVKSLGDGAMSSFASARAALHAAVAVQRAVEAEAGADDLILRIRIGVHAGDVARTEDDVFGSVVDKAARIAAIAEPGGILVSETTRATAEGDPALDLRRLRPSRGAAFRASIRSRASPGPRSRRGRPDETLERLARLVQNSFITRRGNVR